MSEITKKNDTTIVVYLAASNREMNITHVTGDSITNIPSLSNDFFYMLRKAPSNICKVTIELTKYDNGDYCDDESYKNSTRSSG